MHTREMDDTETIVTLALAELGKQGGDVWRQVNRLSVRPDAARIITETYRSSPDPVMRWALVFLAAQLGSTQAIPLLMEAGIPQPVGDDWDRSAARLACEALVHLV